jgi:hypothetical protein
VALVGVDAAVPAAVSAMNTSHSAKQAPRQ